MSLIINTELALSYLTALLNTTRLFDDSSQMASGRGKDHREYVALMLCSQSQSVRFTSSIHYKAAQATFELQDYARNISHDQIFEVSAAGFLKIIKHLHDHQYLELKITADQSFVEIRGAYIQPKDLFGEARILHSPSNLNPTRYKQALRNVEVPALYEFDFSLFTNDERSIEVNLATARRLRTLHSLRAHLPRDRSVGYTLNSHSNHLCVETPFATIKLLKHSNYSGSCRCVLSDAEIRVLFNLIENFNGPSLSTNSKLRLSEQHLIFSYREFHARLLTIVDPLVRAPDLTAPTEYITASTAALQERLRMLDITTDKRRDWLFMELRADNMLALEVSETINALLVVAYPEIRISESKQILSASSRYARDTQTECV